MLRRQLKRWYVLAFFQELPPCLVEIEAYASCHWSRQLQALGHTVRLMPPAYVKPYVKRPKNDATDAEAICEAVTRPNMRFVPTKMPEQRSCLSHPASLHSPADGNYQLDPSAPCRVRDRSASRTQRRRAAAGSRCRCGGHAAPGSRTRMRCRSGVPTAGGQSSDIGIRSTHHGLANETSKRLDAIPGGGAALAAALVASAADPRVFRSGRDFSAWIGLVSKQSSSGGKEKLGNITKQGDRYLRSLFTVGALAVIRQAKLHGTKHRPWLAALLARRPAGWGGQ